MKYEQLKMVRENSGKTTVSDEKKRKEIHHDIYCNECGDEIHGVRYVCPDSACTNLS